MTRLTARCRWRVRGAVLSELHPNTPPKGQTLMARDRIISGLSRAVIVVEAGEKSGSLDTAKPCYRNEFLAPGHADSMSAVSEIAGKIGARPPTLENDESSERLGLRRNPEVKAIV